MKRNLLKMLLVVVTAFGMCGDAFSQTVKDGEYLFMNVGEHKFLAGANSWGTQLSLKDAGDRIGVTLLDSDEGELYSLKDMSRRDWGGNQFIGTTDANDTPNLWIDQNLPISSGGYRIVKVTAKEIAAINAVADEDDVLLDPTQTYYKVLFEAFDAETTFYMSSSGGPRADNESTGDSYIVGRKTLTVLGVWQIMTKAEYAEYLTATATATKPLTATPLIDNADFSRLLCNGQNDCWWDITGTVTLYGAGSGSATDKNWTASATGTVFECKQTVVGLPNGHYRVVAHGVAFDSDGAFEESEMPYFYVSTSLETQKSVFAFCTQPSEMNATNLCSMLSDDANYALKPIEFDVFNGTATFGFKGIKTSYTSYWDNVLLEYMGPTEDPTAGLKQTYIALSQEAEELANEHMHKSVLDELNGANVDINTLGDSQTALSAAITLLTEKVLAAKSSIDVYKKILGNINYYGGKASILDEYGQEKYASYDFETDYENGTLEDEKCIVDAYRAAVLAQNTEGASMTEGLVNPDFETGTTEGWTYESSNDHGAKATSNSTYSVPYGYSHSGNYLFNIWQTGNPISQGVQLHAGSYELTAMGATDAGKSLFLKVTDDNTGAVLAEVEVASGSAKEEGVKVVLPFNLNIDANVTLSAGTPDKYWYKFDNFQLTFVEPVSVDNIIDDIATAVQQLREHMNASMNFDIKAELMTAATEGTQIVNNRKKYTASDAEMLNEKLLQYNELVEKVNASVKIYEKISNYITKGQDLDKDGVKAFDNTTVAEIEKAINNGSITDGVAELNSIQSEYREAVKAQTTENTDMTEAIVNNDCSNGMEFVADGWNTNKYPRQIPNGWHLYDVVGDRVLIDDAFHVNNWSIEADDVAQGGPDGSAMIAPFAELYGFDRNKTNHLRVVHDEETGYRPGQYELKIYVRLRETGSVTSTIPPTGFSFYANGNTSKTSYTDGSNINSPAWYAWYDVKVTVGDNGTLNFGFDLEDWNFNWLAFKLIKLEYLGDHIDQSQIDEFLASVPSGAMNASVEANLEYQVAYIESKGTRASSAELAAAWDAIEAAKLSIASYSAFVTEIAKYKPLAQNLETSGRIYFNDNIDAIQQQYDNRTLTNASVYDLYIESVKAQGRGGEMTALIKNPSFETGNLNGWDIPKTSGETKVAPITHETYTFNGADGAYVFNTWEVGAVGGYPLTQEVSGLPNGNYRLEVNTVSSTNNGVFVTAEVDGVMYHNDPAVTGWVSEQTDIVGSVEFVVTNGVATIGIRGAGSNRKWTDDIDKMNWYKCDNFRLFYMGSNSVENVYEKLQDVIADAETYLDKQMNGTVFVTLKNAVKAGKAATVSYTIPELENIMTNIKNAVAAAQTSIATYEKAVYYHKKAEKDLDAKGLAAYMEGAEELLAEYYDGELTDDKEELTAYLKECKTVYGEACKKQTTAGKDMSLAIVNNDFEDGNMLNWKRSNDDKNQGLGTVTSFAVGETLGSSVFPEASGEYYASAVNRHSSMRLYSMSQTVQGLHAGIYQLKFTASTNSTQGSVVFQAKGYQNTVVPGTTKYTIISVLDDNELMSLECRATLAPGENVFVDDVELIYVGSTEELQMAPGAMNKNDSTLQKKYYDLLYPGNNHAEFEFEYLEPFLEYRQKAEKSAEAYSRLALAMDSCYKYIVQSNVYSREAHDYCMGVLENTQAKFKARTLTTDEANGLVEQWGSTEGFQGNTIGQLGILSQDGITDVMKNKYPVMYYLHDAWKLYDAEHPNGVKYSDAFHVNAWSTEGEVKEGNLAASNMTGPFLEYWHNASDGSLPNAQIKATAIGLEPGLYRVTMFARVMDESNAGAHTDLNHGINFYAKSKANTTESASLTDGTEYLDRTHRVIAGIYQVDSLIVREKDCGPNKDNGTAEIVIDINNTDVTWLSYKFVNLTKRRNLEWYEENTPATDEQIAEFDRLIAYGQSRPIGFIGGKYAPYANVVPRTALDKAIKYREKDQLLKDSLDNFIKDLQEDNWIVCVGDTNAFYNPEFNLHIKGNSTKVPLYGWISEDNGRVISTGAAMPTHTESYKFNSGFNNATEGNLYSTSAHFSFKYSSMAKQSTEVTYTYGSTPYYEMPLECETDPLTGAVGTTYQLAFDHLLEHKTDEGDLIVEIIDPDGNVLESWDESCHNLFDEAKDSCYIMRFKQEFTTEKEGNYRLVFRSGDTDNTRFNVLISNLDLFRKPKVIMEITSAKYGTYIAPFTTIIPENQGITAWVVTGVDEVSHQADGKGDGTYVGNYRTLHLTDRVDLDDISIGDGATIGHHYNMNEVGMIPPNVPVVLRCNTKKAFVRHNPERPTKYGLQYGLLQGTYSEMKAPDSRSDSTFYVLQRHAPNNEACFYRIDYNQYYEENGKALNLSIPPYRAYLKLPNDENGAAPRMLMFDDLEALFSTATFVSGTEAGDEKVVKMVGIYSVDGTPRATLQKGVNILKYSDGSSKKVNIK